MGRVVRQVHEFVGILREIVELVLGRGEIGLVGNAHLLGGRCDLLLPTSRRKVLVVLGEIEIGRASGRERV